MQSRRLATIGAGVAVACVVTLVAALLCRRTCDTRGYLGPMLLHLGESLDQHGVVWALEGGTLLGAMRDHDLLAHEFDNDITLLYSPQIHTQMELVAADLATRGYNLMAIGSHSYIKGIVNLYRGLYAPYINMVNFRLYDSSMWYYTDMYMDEIIAAKDLDRVREERKIPKLDLAPCESYHCTLEPTRGGCRATSVMTPWAMVPFLGRTVRVPHDAPAVLRQLYGPNWNTTVEFKGIKKLWCNDARYFSLLVVLVSLATVSGSVFWYLSRALAPTLPSSSAFTLAIASNKCV